MAIRTPASPETNKLEAKVHQETASFDCSLFRSPETAPKSQPRVSSIEHCLFAAPSSRAIFPGAEENKEKGVSFHPPVIIDVSVRWLDEAGEGIARHLQTRLPWPTGYAKWDPFRDFLRTRSEEERSVSGGGRLGKRRVERRTESAEYNGVDRSSVVRGTAALYALRLW